MTGTEIAQMLLEEDGYIVMAGPVNGEHYIGETIRSDGFLERTSEVTGPFVVIGESTAEEFLSQMHRTGNEWPKELRKELRLESRRFYKVIAE